MLEPGHRLPRIELKQQVQQGDQALAVRMQKAKVARTPESNANATWTDTMKRKKTVSPHFAVCVKNTGYSSSLELHKIYRVIHDEDAAEGGDIRIVDESGEDYLYPAQWFAEIKLPQEVQESLMHVA